MAFPELLITVFSSVQPLSHVRVSNAMDCSMPSCPVQHELLEPAQIQVHQVGDAIQPSHPVIPFSFCLQYSINLCVLS